MAILSLLEEELLVAGQLKAAAVDAPPKRCWHTAAVGFQ
jgi:hypothetical protein